MKLVIVESPTKAKTIGKYLPKDFVVESSFGHIRDLPQSASDIPAKFKKESWSRLGINIHQNFTPLYVIPKAKTKQVAKLKKLVQQAEAIYLATDEDREGEAISWHLVQVLQPTVPVHRMVFHEITKEAILGALEQPRDIDQHLVSAQETRRILDRLYGYEVSPILWRKVAPKLSAGRVQSAALHLIVQREQDRMAFHSAAYWDVTGSFITTNQETFTARLTTVNGQRLASGKDFDGQTGALNASATRAKVMVLDEAPAKTIAQQLTNTPWKITTVIHKPFTASPKPPFITSTLQQDAGRKYGWSASRTMRLAQRLYEQGFITYMRTDSVQLSDEARQAARKKIQTVFGSDYLPALPRFYRNKSRTAQEAHEAIRPAGKLMRSVTEVNGQLDGDEAKLYDLIWKRTLASQMTDAKLKQTTAQLEHAQLVASANGRVVEFPGYYRVYGEGADSEDMLPPLVSGQMVQAQTGTAESHHTKPPARFTEAALIKELEQLGIGRPSTYATIIDTIQNRGYVYKDGPALIPRFVAFAVDALLANNFRNLVDTKYTATMEEDLDTIAAGQLDPQPYLQGFYFGNAPKQQPGLHTMLQVDIDARQTCTFPLGTAPDGQPVNVRVGRYGPFVEHKFSEGEKTASIPADLPPDQLTVDLALEYIAQQAAGPTALGSDPASGQPVYVLQGRFGPYVQLGEKPAKTEGKKGRKPKMKGLLKGMQPADVTLEVALGLLAFPKVLGVYPKTGEEIVADAGRFGPYIRCGTETRSLSVEDNLLELTLERAMAMLDTPKLKGRRARVLRSLGSHPSSSDTVQLYDGRYGPYIKCGKINVSLPKTLDPNTITLDQAVALVEQKRNK